MSDQEQIPIEFLGLSRRSCNVLKRDGINTVADLERIGGQERLLRIYQLGEKSAKEILESLERLGFQPKVEIRSLRQANLMRGKTYDVANG